MRDHTRGVVPEGQRLLGLDLSNVYRPVNFYADGLYLDLYRKTADVLPLLERDTPVQLLMNEQRLGELPQELRDRLTVEYRTRTSRRDVALVRIDPATSARPGGARLPAAGTGDP